LGTILINEIIYYYLLTIAAVLFSDFTISKSENKTLLAKKIKVISRIILLRFFMVSRFIGFGLANFQNIYGNTKKINEKSLKNVNKLHFVDKI